MEKYRLQLNEIDEEMRKLFEKRLDVVKQIGMYKKENKLPIYDAEREKFIIDRGIANLDNEQYDLYYRQFLENLMEISKDLQSTILK